MRKKLTTIMLAALIILIGKVDAATLTQKIGDGILQSQVTPGKEVTVKYIDTKHEFAGWTVETGNVVIDTTSKTVTFTMPDADVILRANFTEIVEMYTITYDANGGSGAPEAQTVVKGQSVTISSVVPTYAGHTFKGWSTASDARTAGYVAGETITPESDMTLYAVWSKFMTVTLKGGTPETLTVECGENLTITSTEPTRSDATFIGWRYEDSLYRNGDNIENVKSDLVIPDIWQCTLTFLNGNGTVFKTVNVEKGQSYVIAVGTPSGTGTFKGWTGNGITYANGGTISGVSAHITLTPIFTSVSTYTITYDANGGSGAPASQTGTAGGSTNISTTIPTAPSGKSFRGWTSVIPSQHNEDTIAQYKPGAYIEKVYDMTLYAVWRTPLAAGSDFDDVEVGAYVTYEPTKTSYSVPTSVSGTSSIQTYNPSSTTKWRVFTNDGTNVEIISDECVSNSQLLKLDKDTGYINMVQTLQDLSAAYINTKYAISARHFGYSEKGLSPEQIANYRKIDTAKYPLNYGVSGFPYGDNQYSYDQLVVTANGSLRTKDKMSWLASRGCTQGTSTSFVAYYFARFDGYVYYGALSRTNSDGTVNNSIGGLTYGVRPVVKLGLGLKVASGDGSPNNPYVLAEPTQFTVTYDANGGSGAPAPHLVNGGVADNLSTTIPTAPTGKSFRGWATTPDATVAEYKAGGAIKLDANITLYAVYVTPLAVGSDILEADVGAYVRYAPSSTSATVLATKSGYSTDQTFNPSNTTLWRVFDKVGTNVEIVSDENVGKLSLKGEAGYINYVETLQNLSAAYVTSDYAISARHLGYNETGLTQNQIQNYNKIDISTYALTKDSSGFPYEDSQCDLDVSIIDNNGLLKTGDNTSFALLASRNIGLGSTSRYFRIYYQGTLLAVKNYNVLLAINKTTNEEEEKTLQYAVRPIVKLREGVKVAGGDGSLNNPYRLDFPSITLTYNANGGSNVPASQRTADTGGDWYNFEISTSQPTPPSGKAFRGWSTDPNATIPEYQVGAEISVEGDTTLYAVYATKMSVGALVRNADIGAYITYEPTNTSYTVSRDMALSPTGGVYYDQTFNPSSTTTWRVLTNTTRAEIISNDSVGCLVLGGMNGYINAVQVLQDLAAAYVDDEYAVSARSLGYGVSHLIPDEVVLENYGIINTNTYPLSQDAELGSEPYTDFAYMEDWDDNSVQQNYSVFFGSDDEYCENDYGYYGYGTWLASRNAGEPDEKMGVRFIQSGGYIGRNGLYGLNGFECDYGAGVRVIVKLDLNARIGGGDGSPNNPYILY